jgi:hypothetical protein
MQPGKGMTILMFGLRLNLTPVYCLRPIAEIYVLLTFLKINRAVRALL